MIPSIGPGWTASRSCSRSTGCRATGRRTILEANLSTGARWTSPTAGWATAASRSGLSSAWDGSTPGLSSSRYRIGTSSGEPVSLVDLYPNLIEICGLTPRDGLSGRSLVPLLRNPSLQTGRVVITSFGEGNYALTGSRWRYIRYRDGSEELYDSKNDPHEWNNLAPEPAYREVLNELFRTYQEIKPKNL